MEPHRMSEENKTEESRDAPDLHGTVKVIRRLAKHQVRQLDAAAEHATDVAEQIAHIEQHLAAFQARTIRSLAHLEEKMKWRQEQKLLALVLGFLLMAIMLAVMRIP